MKLNIKSYKLQKIEQYLKDKKLFFIFNQTNVASEKKRQLNSKFLASLFEIYNLCNKLTKKVFNGSIYSSMSSVINGPTVFVVSKNDGHFRNNGYNFQSFVKPTETTCFLGLKLNHKFYSSTQLSKLRTLNYSQNVKTLHGSLKKSLLFPYRNFKKVSK